MKSAVTRRLADDVEVRVVTAPYYIATKLAAFIGRGREDLLGSRDLEDLISVVDGRVALIAEVQAEETDLRASG
jgi:predicted nucleotidyltransferase